MLQQRERQKQTEGDRQAARGPYLRSSHCAGLRADAHLNPGLPAHLSTLGLADPPWGRQPLPIKGPFGEPLPWGQGLEVMGLGQGPFYDWARGVFLQLGKKWVWNIIAF